MHKPKQVKPAVARRYTLHIVEYASKDHAPPNLDRGFWGDDCETCTRDCVKQMGLSFVKSVFFTWSFGVWKGGSEKRVQKKEKIRGGFREWELLVAQSQIKGCGVKKLDFGGQRE